MSATVPVSQTLDQAQQVKALTAEVERLRLSRIPKVCEVCLVTDMICPACSGIEQKLAAATANVQALVEALPPADKLRLLADWIDLKVPGDTNPEVQHSLRTWADIICTVLARLAAVRGEETR